jgi:GAF domain-containing protein
VLEVLDRRGDAGFGLHDIELASVFARQAAVAIRASRVEREVGELLRATLARLSTDGTGDPDEAVDAAVAAAVAGLDDGDGSLWALADAVARARAAAPGEVALVIEILDALARRAPRQPSRFRR